MSNRSSHDFFRRPLVVSAVLVVASALVALVIWTIPNWGEFSQNVSQLPVLWQVSSNQDKIKSMIAKVFSPVIIAFLVGACCWLWYTVKPFVWQEKEEAHSGAEVPFPRPAARQQSTTQRQTPFAPAPPALPPQPASQSTTPITPTDPITPLPAVLEESRAELGEQLGGTPQEELRDRWAGGNAQDTGTTPSPVPAGQAKGDTQAVYITLHLLDEVRVDLHTPDGTLSEPIPLSGTAIRVHLLAYVAWLQGKKVGRDKMLEDVFGHGKSDEEATAKRLGDAFDSHRKFLRQDLRNAIDRLNAQAGQVVIPLDLDFFENRNRLWSLAPACRVVDLAAVEASFRVIEQAVNEGLLANSVPEHVHAACLALIDVYKGDFLGNLLTDYPDEFDPWHQSWVRKPFTLYRDYYLDALWYAAGYELQKGQAIDGEADETQQQKQRQHYDRAARMYRTFAMHAVNSKYDLKVSFRRTGREHGERIVQSERALRRAIMLYGAMDNTHMVDRVWTAYSKYMKRFSVEAWSPDADTEKDLEAARSRTSAYRLSSQITLPGPLETADRS